jgi:hypothetical protein
VFLYTRELVIVVASPAEAKLSSSAGQRRGEAPGSESQCSSAPALLPVVVDELEGADGVVVVAPAAVGVVVVVRVRGDDVDDEDVVDALAEDGPGRSVVVGVAAVVVVVASVVVSPRWWS